jgi:BASS family bile acid:Na+ symporter
MESTQHVIAQVGILAGVFTGMLAIGTSVPGSQILASLRHPRLLALALLTNFVAVPLFALALARVLPLSPEGRIGLILLGACAGAPLLPTLARLAHGRLSFSIGLMVLLMAITVVYAPFVLPFLLPDASVLPGEIARSLLVIMLLPLALGLASQARYPEVAGWSRELSRISSACMAIGLAAGLLLGWRQLLATLGSWLVPAAILLGLGAAGIGWLAAGAASRDVRQVAALGAGMRNFSAALVVAGHDFGPSALVTTMAGVIALIVVLVIVAGEMGRRPGSEPRDAASPGNWDDGDGAGAMAATLPNELRNPAR